MSRRRIIMVEGPDGVGKTKYVDFLRRVTGGIVLHWGPPTNSSWVEEYVVPVAHALSRSDIIICDRGFIAEPLWEGIFERGGSLFGHPSEFEACAEWYRLNGLEVHILMRDAAGIEETIMERGESPEDLRRALQSVPLYEELAYVLEPRTGIPTRTLNSDTVHVVTKWAEQTWS
jgi:hypothetical protein